MSSSSGSSRSSGRHSRNNTPPMSPKSPTTDNVPYSKRIELAKAYNYRLIFNPKEVKKHLSEEYKNNKNAKDFLSRNNNNGLDVIKSHEPIVKESLLKKISNRFTIGKLENIDSYKYVPVTANIQIDAMDIILLKDGSAVYNRNKINAGDAIYVAIGATKSIPKEEQEDLYERTFMIDENNNYVPFDIDVYLEASKKRFHSINPLDIAGVIKPSDAFKKDANGNTIRDANGKTIRNEDGYKLNIYWKNFIAVSYELNLKHKGQTVQSAGKTPSKFLYIGKSRKRIYTVNGLPRVRDGKYKNGKDKYVSVASYKKKYL